MMILMLVKINNCKPHLNQLIPETLCHLFYICTICTLFRRPMYIAHLYLLV
ncbi:uncharacterized protein BX663DRAFT_506763 [Cokeromyces recurvatus]|uniref:uncharacterized protein n=1 Tax=Cokeromyces recurvatus TaxID=90255 RepID=UPI00222006AB|nr:uncharacterized protein BX663DRAFT_506763 [Cokeromyces recurvatus]KAI7903529.1 hypothetical protein BX663DRAFT_506763 [Cokeromyces recurvatus]